MSILKCTQNRKKIHFLQCKREIDHKYMEVYQASNHKASFMYAMHAYDVMLFGHLVMHVHNSDSHCMSICPVVDHALCIILLFKHHWYTYHHEKKKKHAQEFFFFCKMVFDSLAEKKVSQLYARNMKSLAINALQSWGATF